MNHRLIAAITCVAIALAGCQVSTEPRTVQKLSPREAASMTRAAWNGQYTLYSVSNDKKPVKTQIQSAHLHKDEPVGFRVREGGVIVGVAGELEVPVSNGTYEWVMTADAGQTDPGATAVLIVVIVVVAVGVTAAILAIQVQHGLKDFSNSIH